MTQPPSENYPKGSLVAIRTLETSNIEVIIFKTLSFKVNRRTAVKICKIAAAEAVQGVLFSLKSMYVCLLFVCYL